MNITFLGWGYIVFCCSFLVDRPVRCLESFSAATHCIDPKTLNMKRNSFRTVFLNFIVLRSLSILIDFIFDELYAWELFSMNLSFTAWLVSVLGDSGSFMNSSFATHHFSESGDSGSLGTRRSPPD